MISIGHRVIPLHNYNCCIYDAVVMVMQSSLLTNTRTRQSYCRYDGVGILNNVCYLLQNISSLRANSKHAASTGRLFGSAQDISSSVKLRKSKSSQLISQSTSLSFSFYDDALFEPEYPLHGPVSMNDFQVHECLLNIDIVHR
jgi:hypothetical protein